ncbi:MAG: DUF1761 domain-containing protein [Pseudomonadota bacterium]
MDIFGVNVLVILGAAVASYVFGAAWYMALSKPWAAALGTTTEQMSAEGSASSYVIAFIAQLVMAYVLAGVFAHVMKDQVTVYGSIISALMIWVGFIVTTMTVNHRFQNSPWSLTAIDSGHWLGVLMIQAAVIGFFGV